ncbi:MAG: class I SAM-dependent methyltransferase [Candidatus Pacebacteria bacterium]|nr:class I SAM-dependent methyltransferase [Candidatus Paceibacterota bacterium]
MNTFSDPTQIVEQFDIVGGQHIADLGAGSGAYCFALAEKFKNNSDTKIFGIDVQRDLLARLESEAENRGLHAIHGVWGDIEEPKGTRLRDQSIDTVIIANTLFQVDHKKGLIEEVTRILRPEGKLIIIDWSESFGHIGPKPDHVITEAAAKSLCEDAGFTLRKDIEAGEHHYGFIMVRT